MTGTRAGFVRRRVSERVSARRAVRSAPTWLLLLVLLAGAAGCQRGITPIRTSYNKGVYHFSKRNYEEAIAEYRDAREANPRDHRAHFNLAVSLEARADELERAGETQRAAELQAEAEEEYRRLLDLKPDDLRASINLAACQYENGQTDDAKERLRGLIEQYPGVALPRTALAAHVLAEARAAESSRLLDEARRLIDEAVGLDPTNVAALMLQGDVAVALGDQDRARKSYRRALKRDPSDIATLLALARLEVEAENWGQAGVWLQRVLYIDRDHFESHALLATVLEKQGDLEGATRHLWEARQLDDGAHPGIASPDYRDRLVGLYERLLTSETSEGE